MKKKAVLLIFLGLLVLSTTIQAQSLVIWANNGQDKVTRDELRAHASATAVYNSVWNGTRISVFGAKNEVIAFNLILESPTTATNNVKVTVSALTGPGGFTISGRTLGQGQLADGLFNYIGRNIELFYVRYLQIRGLSRMAYDSSYYDERHAPIRLQRPMNSYHVGVGTWNDRPDHDKYYPDIAVPLELHTPFSIPANSNQSIWVDVFIPKTAPAGVYNGTVTVQVGTDATQIPVVLRVRDFTLPDIPSAKTMLVGGEMEDDTNLRYTGVAYPNAGTPEYNRMIQVSIRHNQMAHRHKISSLRGGWAALPANLKQEDVDQLTGALFTHARGYDGPGIGTGSNVLSVGTYGAWRTTWGFTAAANDNERRQIMWDYSNQWVDWFNAQNFQTPTEFFLYLIDESTDYAQTERWAGWLENNPGSGSALMSFATINVLHAVTQTPSLDIASSWHCLNVLGTWENASAHFINDPNKRLHMYNGSRSERGSFVTEDEGISLRVTAWAQFKKKIDRWFFWQSTYYNDTQSGMGQTNVFQSARTFGGDSSFQFDSPARGRTGWNYSNGDGVLFYPGTELYFPAENYGINGPIASLRLKLWRRGIQDVDYLTLASNIDPAQTNAIVNRIIPQVLWEFGAGDDSDPNDPTWVKHDISWSVDPDVWEDARVELADIIDGGISGGDTEAPTVPQNLTATAVSSSQINLSWTASTDNVGVTAYRIYRGSTQIATVSNTTYNNVGLTANTTYTYTVLAYDAAGNPSGQSAPASATTQGLSGDTEAPTVPQTLSATVVSSSQINLTWTASTDNVGVVGYRIYRNGINVNSTASTSYGDFGLSSNTPYTYTVSAYDATGNESGQSNPATATTLGNGGRGGGRNHAPILNHIGNKTVSVGNSLSFKLSASDSDNDKLNFFVTNLPYGAKFNNKTRTFSWKPKRVGKYYVTFRVSDGRLSDSETIMIRVKRSGDEDENGNRYGIVITLEAERKTDKSWLNKRDYGQIKFRIIKGNSKISRVILYRRNSGKIFEAVKDFSYKGVETVVCNDAFLETTITYTYKMMIVDNNNKIIASSNEVSI